MSTDLSAENERYIAADQDRRPHRRQRASSSMSMRRLSLLAETDLQTSL